MRRAWILLFGAAALTSACMTTHYQYQVGISVPDTPEGQACVRECMALIGTCTYYSQGDKQVIVVAGRYSSQYGCPGLISDCLETCPGARFSAINPPRMIEVDVSGKRIVRSSTDDEDEDADE